jgi:large subunit ribosomal protein L10
LDQLQALARLPSKEELLVQLLFLMQSSTTQFVRTLNEVPAKFVRTLAAIAQSKE